MGFFFSNPIVGQEEFKKVRSYLYSNGFSEHDLTELKKIFSASLTNQGINRKELEAGLRWLRENMGHHTFSKNQVNMIEEAMNKKL